MTKFRLYFNKDKETTWLNDMVKKGYALTKFFAGFYTFEACEPGEYEYQIDFGDTLYAVTDDYREFMAENNIEIVCLWGYWIILRKRTTDGKFVLYTDVDSSIEHYTKILKMFKAVTAIELVCFIMQTFAALSGAAVGFYGMAIIGALCITLMNATLSTKKTINELKERKGEAVPKGFAGGNVSPTLIAGLFLNLGATALHNSSMTGSWIMVVQIIALIVMLVGIYQSRGIFTE